MNLDLLPAYTQDATSLCFLYGDYGVHKGGISSEDRLLVACYRGCILLRFCAHLSTQVGLPFYHTDDRVRFLEILGFEE